MTIILGTTRNDTKKGGNGSDAIYGLAGNDRLSGNKGNDLLSGGTGNDTLDGGLGADTLSGGLGKDIFLYTSANFADKDKIVDFSLGDTLDFSKIAGHRFIGSDDFTGVAGQIRANYQTTYFGGNVTFEGTDKATTVEIDSNGDGEADATLILVGRVNLTEVGRTGKLIFAQGISKSGGARNDTLTGGMGNDTLSGAAGKDTLQGGEGNDNLIGGLGDDTLDGNRGLDVLTGGGGKDTFRISEISSGYERITDFSTGDQVFINIKGFSFIADQEFSGTPGEYRIYQGNGNNNDQSRIEFDTDGDTQIDAAVLLGSAFNAMLQETKPGSNRLAIANGKNLNGTAGADTITGTNGNDTIKGLDGNDKLSGGTGDDTISGAEGNDTVLGGSGNDIMSGGLGNDVLIGGQGADVLFGAAGSDIFKFLSVSDMQSPGRITSFSKNDEIRDFGAGDKIDLATIDANTNLIGNQKFAYIGSKNFTGTAGEVRFVDAAFNTSLEGDVNGDGEADFTITLTGIKSLAASSLIL